jgi:hypothetical protein
MNCVVIGLLPLAIGKPSAWHSPPVRKYASAGAHAREEMENLGGPRDPVKDPDLQYDLDCRFYKDFPKESLSFCLYGQSYGKSSTIGIGSLLTIGSSAKNEVQTRK